MTRPARVPRGSSLWLFLVVAAATVGSGAAAQDDSVAGTPPRDARSGSLDLTLPAPEAFRGWPPDELLERPYWLPWNWMSFQRASMFDRPVLLMLTVPWSRQARRMEQQTLSDPRVLRALNAGWICIVVNADRRPEIRERYQTGSWPTLAFLLPDGNPMLSQANPQEVALPITISFVDPERMLFLLREGRTYYARQAALLRGVGAEWARRESTGDPVPGPATEDASDQLARWLLGNADRTEGGFGAAPKFVAVGLAEYAALRDARLLPALLEIAQLTYRKLVASPLYDTRHGGVHRIAARPQWKGIEFEKVLERQTTLVRELTFALRSGASAELEQALADTAAYMAGVLGRAGGGFYQAQKALPRPERDEAGNVLRVVGELDRTVIAGANFRASAALLRAAARLEDPALFGQARASLDWALARAYRTGRGVNHVIEPRPHVRPYLESQADTALALLDAFEATGVASYLDAARDIVDFAELNFAGGEDQALLRDHLPDPVSIGILDNPRFPLTPNVRLARAMVRLAAHGLGEGYRQRARAILERFAGDLTLYGVQGIEPALALEELLDPPLVVELGEAVGDQGPGPLRRAALDLPWPWTLITAGKSGVPAGRPYAVLQRGERSIRVESPDELRSAAARLTGLVEADPPGGGSRD